jgi:pimeloyl-ACP methyl ester carboxylesterase
MADFILVQGAWLGAWCWQRVLPGLWSAGHRAWGVPLSGVGERAHQLDRGIRLATHVQDVCAWIEAGELKQVVLLGHSYSGVVVTGVADRLAERIARLVYLDAVVPRSGESWSSGHTPETQAQRRQAIADSGGIPPADPALFGLQGEDAAWLQCRQTPQPGGVYDDALHFDEAGVASLPRCFIDCTQPALKTIEASRQRVREQPGWQRLEIATGHVPMVSAPDALLRHLLSLAGTPPP